MRRAEDYGRGRAHLEVDDIAILFRELVEPEPRLADTGLEGRGTGGKLGAAGAEFPLEMELVGDKVLMRLAFQSSREGNGA